MISIEKRVKISVKIVRSPDTECLVPYLEFKIGNKIPLPWYDREKGNIVRFAPIVSIDNSDENNPVFTLDVSEKYHKRLITTNLDNALEYIFDRNDISINKYNSWRYIESIDSQEYDAIVSGLNEYVLDDIICVGPYNIKGRIIEIFDDTFTLDTSNDTSSSSVTYSVRDVRSITES